MIEKALNAYDKLWKFFYRLGWIIFALILAYIGLSKLGIVPLP